MRNLSSYTRIGAALLLAGALSAPVFYFVAGSIPLTALALSAMLLGLIAVLLSRSLPTLPPRAAEVLLDAGLENLAGLLEELGVDSRAVYLPAQTSGGKPRALIPLHQDSHQLQLSRQLPARMIVEFGPAPEDVGILISTPGTTVAEFLETPPGPGSADLEAALARLLIGTLDVAASVQVTRDNDEVVVRAAGVRLDHQDSRASRVLGSPVASVAATVVAEGTGRPVIVLNEELAGRTLVVRLEILA